MGGEGGRLPRDVIVKGIKGSSTPACQGGGKMEIRREREKRIYIISIGIGLGLIGIINNIKIIEGINIINKKEIGISIIMFILYIIINKWLITTKEKGRYYTNEIIIGISCISIILFIYNKGEIGIIYIILELYTMTIYIIINYNNKKNIYNNIIYFFINSISSILLLLIISLIYYNYGLINLKDYIYINNTYLFSLFVFILLFSISPLFIIILL